MRKFFKGKRVIACLTALTMMLSVVSSAFAVDNILEDNLVIEDNATVELMYNYDSDEAPIHPMGVGYRFDYNTKTLYISDAINESPTSGSEKRFGWYACAIDTKNPTRDDGNYTKLSDTIVRISDLTERIVIEEGVTEIGNYAFQQYTIEFPNLKSMSLPSTLTTIGVHSFDGFDFTALGVDMDVFDDIVSVGNYGFSNCTFSAVNFESLEDVGKYAFMGITADSFELSNKVTTLSDSMFLNAKITGGKFVVPDTVNYIGYDTFSCFKVENFYLGNNSCGIHSYAFDRCNITNFHVYKNRLYIRDFAFSDSPSDIWYHGLKNDAAKTIEYQNSWNNNYFRKKATWHYEEIKTDDIEDQYFYGSAVEPEVTVKHVFLDDSSEKTLTEGTDYTVSYENNDRVGTAVATITGIGDYEGEISTVKFNILNGLVSNFSIGSISSYQYSGEEKMPTPTVKNNGITLTEGTDYILSYANNVNAGTATVTVTGMGKYTGSKSKDFTINPYGIANVKVSSIPTQNYTGSPIEVYPEVTFGDDILLQEGVDYDISFQNNKAVGNASVKITGKGNFVGSKMISFKIKSTSDGTWDGPDLYYYYGYAPSYYDAILDEITLTAPDGTVFRGEEIGIIELRHYRYDSDEDYEEWIGEIPDMYGYGDGPLGIRIGDTITVYVSEFNSDNVTTEHGFSSWMANSTGNYYTMTVLPNKEDISSFGILASRDGWNFDGLEFLNFEYTGTPIEPKISLSTHVGSEYFDLTSNGNFETYFENNVNAGTATVTIMGLGETVVGTRTTTFEIGQADIANATAESLPDVTYTGYAFEPKPTLTYNGITLYEGTDYTLSYEDNTNVGYGKVTVTGIGNFTGTQELQFLINYKDITDEVEAFVNGYYMYKGTPVEPTDLTVTYAGEEIGCTIQGYSNNNAVGTGIVSIYEADNSNYTFAKDVEFTINEYKPWFESGIDIDNSSISYDTGGSLIYTGFEQYPEKLEIKYTYKDPVTNTNKTYTLVENVDYRIDSYYNNINAGCAVVVVDGMNESGQTGFYGTIDCDYQISPVAIDFTDLKMGEDVYYTGNTIYPNLEFSLYGNKLIEGEDYDFWLLDDDCKDVGQHIIEVDGKGNFDSSIKVTYNILPADFTQVEAVFNSQISFDDLVEEPTSFAVTYNGKTLTLGTDYEVVSWANNTKIGTATATLKGIGNYSGTKEVPFDIREDLCDATGYVNETCVYNGAPVEPSNIVLEHNGLEGVTLVEGRDYKITSYSNNNAVGTGTVTITGLGYFEGTKTIQFEIIEPDLGIFDEVLMEDVVATINDTYTFDGTAKEPVPTLVYTYSNPDTGNTTDFTLVEGTNFEVSYPEGGNINAGTGTVTVTGLGNVKGTKDVQFTINQADISAASLTPVEDQYYTGSMIDPDYEIKLGDYVLVEGTDYMVGYMEEPINVGTAYFYLTGSGNFTGTKYGTFEIITNAITTESTTVTVENQTFTGSELKPEPVVKYGDTVLVKDTDYTVSYSDNVNAGKGKVTITGKGQYSGSITVEFTISPIDASQITIAPVANQKYTGQPIMPDINATR